MPSSAILRYATLLCAMLLAGCDKDTNDAARSDATISEKVVLDAQAVRAFTLADEAEFNTLAITVHDLLSQLSEVGQARGDQLVLQGTEGYVPIDWWLWKQGLLSLKGVSGGQPVFGLSSIGNKAASQPPPWFALKPSGSATGNCGVGESITNVVCQISAPFELVKTPAGQAALQKSQLPAVTTTGTVRFSGGVWVSDPFDSSSKQILMDALFGNAEAIAGNQAAFVKEINDQIRNQVQQPSLPEGTQ